MVTSIKNLKNEVDSRLVAGGLDSLACCQLQCAQTVLNNNIVYRVASISVLPSAALNEGRFIYIDDINEYRLSDGIGWLDDFNSTINTYQNQLWSWGRNTCGPLGNGITFDRNSPVREISSSTDWCQVSAGTIHTTAIKTSGQLWSWGRNSFATLGDGTTIDRCSPVREFCSATDWRRGSAGEFHTAAVKTTGELWSWGSAGNGRLGDGTQTNKCSPVREISSSTDWCQVSAGSFHTAAVKTTGQIWAWGRNNVGQLGDGTSVDRCSPVRERCSATDWCQVTTACYHSAAVKTTGELWAWGGNLCGRLGDGTTVNKCSPVREFCSATDWCQVSAGVLHTTAVKTTGQIWSWGLNSFSQLGNGITVNSCSPVREICSATDWCGVSTGMCHTAAIKTSGQIWAWGRNVCGPLGDGTFTNRCSPVREISSATDWCQVSAGCQHTVAINNITKGFLE
jgi:alpha-tubulin suppressor-like RCC1 family protein